MEETREQIPPFPNLLQALILLFILGGLMMSIGMLAMMFFYNPRTGASGGFSEKFGVIAAIGYLVPFFLVILLGHLRQRSGLSRYFSRPNLPWKAWAGMAAGTLGLLLILEPLVSLIPIPEFFKTLFEQAFTQEPLVILLIVIAAPLFEEWLFRGILLNGFLRLYTPAKAIVWSAVLFGVIHLNPWQGLPAVVLGALFGWLTYRSGSILPAIALHALANGTGVLVYWFTGNANAGFSDIIVNPFGYAALAIALLAIGWWSGKFYLLENKETETAKVFYGG
ncbi:MAG: hypothetical protein Kow0037_05810 [Calditrichia bacterium]